MARDVLPRFRSVVSLLETVPADNVLRALICFGGAYHPVHSVYRGDRGFVNVFLCFSLIYCLLSLWGRAAFLVVSILCWGLSYSVDTGAVIDNVLPNRNCFRFCTDYLVRAVAQGHEIRIVFRSHPFRGCCFQRRSIHEEVVAGDVHLFKVDLLVMIPLLSDLQLP